MVGVVVFIIRGLVRVREDDSCKVGRSIFADMEEFHKLVLYTYWSFVWY